MQQISQNNCGLMVFKLFVVVVSVAGNNVIIVIIHKQHRVAYEVTTYKPRFRRAK